MSSEPATARIIESEPAPVPSSRRECIEFLNNSIIFAEANIRTFVDPLAMSSTYAEKLQGASFEAELTGEVLKLAYIRAGKGRRFRYALWSTGGFYLLVFVSFLLLQQRCN